MDIPCVSGVFSFVAVHQLNEFHTKDSHDVLSLPTPRLHGYDLSYQGLQGIWDGIPTMVIQSQPLPAEDTPVAGPRPFLLDLPPPGLSSHPSYSTSSGNMLQERQTSRRSHSPVDDLHGNWPAALAALAARRGADSSSWKPTVATAKLVQRQIALQLCGWSLREDELMAAIKRFIFFVHLFALSIYPCRIGGRKKANSQEQPVGWYSQSNIAKRWIF